MRLQYAHIVGTITLALVGACGAKPASQSASIGPKTPTKSSDDGPSATTVVASTTSDNTGAVESPVTPRPKPPIEIPNGRLYQGFILGGLPSKAQFDAALAADIEAAMSLMTNGEAGGSEIASYASSQGIRYLHFTIDGIDGLTEANAWEFAATLSMLDKPAIIHSKEGRRVGAIFALMAYFVEELSAEEAYKIGVEAGMGDFSVRVRELLDLPPE